MGWRAAWRLGRVAYAELSFQAIYAFRLGALPPRESALALVPLARRRVAQSQALVGAVLALLTVGAAFLARTNPTGATSLLPHAVPPATWAAGVLTGLFGIDTAFLWWAGLQILPTFLASGILPVLEALPIDPPTLRRTALLLYLRLFDTPALVVLLLTPVAVGAAFGPLAGLAALLGAAVCVLFALALSLATGRFFARRIQGSRGGGGRTLLRWGYLLLWLVPAFAILGFVAAGSQFFSTLLLVSQSGRTLAGDLLLTAFPFPFGLLAALGGPAGPTAGVKGLGQPLLIAVIGGYSALGVWAGFWLYRTVGRLGATPALPPQAGPPPRFDLRTRGPATAVIVKDLRIASRSPSYAFLLLLPLLDALGLGLVTIADAPRAAEATALGLAAVTAAALLATFFGPAFFAIEVVAYAYGRTLPLTDRSVLVGKVALVALVYVSASVLALGLTLVRVFTPLLFVLFVAAELPAVVAAGVLEIAWLYRRAARRGVAIPNLYTGGWAALLVAVPGVIVAGAPLIAFRIAGLPTMAVIAVAEVLTAGVYALGVRAG
jgi:predicted permease